MGVRASDGVTIEGSVTVRVHDIADLEAIAARRGLWWSELSQRAKLALANAVQPTSTHESHNATLDEFHTHLVDVVDPSQSANAYTAAYLAVGTGDTTPASTDTGLGNEVDRVEVTWTEDQGDDLFTSTLLDTSVANGHTLSEVALASNASAGSGIEFDRALITDTPKTANETVTVEVTLTFA